jgi:cystathionine beta-lyase
MSADIFSKLYRAGAPFALIDCRERRDYVNAHWFGSTNIPFSVLSRKIKGLVPDLNFSIHVMDWQDNASTLAISQLKTLGYTNIKPHKTVRPPEMGNGFIRGEYVWSKAFGEVVAHCANLPEVTPADYVANYQDALLFDVRPTAEYRDFTLPGSQSLPNSLLLANVDALRDTGKMTLLHCAGRTRSIIGACTLKAAGYDGPFAIFKGGTQAWQLDGHEREHNSNRIFAKDIASPAIVERFLRRWLIPFDHINEPSTVSFITRQRPALIFDVSDDAATGQKLMHGVVKISGTNLIQQTDRSIACYHVPVVLFDHGSGSRAAFAAYWLRAMGFEVRVALLASQLEPQAADGEVDRMLPSFQNLLSIDDIRDLPSQLLDFRPSSAYRKGHIEASEWANITSFLEKKPNQTPMVIICDDISTGSEISALLKSRGWQIRGVYHWREDDFDLAHLAHGGPALPIDESALFAGRHQGVLQDARDYLTWEEDLPAEINQDIHQMWKSRISAKPETF